MKLPRCRCAIAAACLLCLCAACSCPANDLYPGKKLIEYGADVPDTAFVRANISRMETQPFDGVVMLAVPPAGNKTPLGRRIFSTEAFTPAECDPIIADLKATHFKRFTDNFLEVITASTLDWFDPHWSVTEHNAAMLARVAKLGGLKGFSFDPEDYGRFMWNYNIVRKRHPTQYSFQQYRERVHTCGELFMRAINSQYPNITIICWLGPSFAYLETKGRDLESSKYALFMPFLNGMIDAAAPGTRIVDAYEQSYGYRILDAFKDSRVQILDRTKELSDDPAAYKSHVRAGFGVWMNNDYGNIPFSTTDYSKNYFTPAGFRATLAYALKESDRYVWVYSQGVSWWDFTVPKPYVQALALAKAGPGPGEPHPLPVKTSPASDQAGYGDGPAFARFTGTMKEIYDFPKDAWRFHTDPYDVGQKEGWEKSGFNASCWRTIRIGDWWEDQGVNYDGHAWYRKAFTAPAIPRGRKVYIVFGAVDESASVWLNGRYVGQHEIGEAGWDKPFALDVTQALRGGKTNVLAVCDFDRNLVGGIWKSVKLMVK